MLHDHRDMQLLTRTGTPRSTTVNPLLRPRKWWHDRRFERRFVDEYLHDRALLRRCEAEVRRSGLVSHLADKADEFWATVRGQTYRGSSYNTGRATGREEYTEGVRLYAVVRKLRPATIVETGVCNGFSTSFLLLGLHANAHGDLHSVDFPEVAGVDYEPGTFWEGKAGSVVPPGEEPGWAIPDRLRDRWQLTVGKSEDVLPGLVERVGSIDMFMHDSAPTYEVTSFEYATAFPALRNGGVVVGNNHTWTASFAELSERAGCPPIPVSHKMALIVK